MKAEFARVQVKRFWLQPTPYFPEGAPQREDYMAEYQFDRACVRYAEEWRETYVCDGCGNFECPQCGVQGSQP